MSGQGAIRRLKSKPSSLRGKQRNVQEITFPSKIPPVISLASRCATKPTIFHGILHEKLRIWHWDRNTVDTQRWSWKWKTFPLPHHHSPKMTASHSAKKHAGIHLYIYAQSHTWSCWVCRIFVLCSSDNRFANAAPCLCLAFPSGRAASQVAQIQPNISRETADTLRLSCPSCMCPSLVIPSQGSQS